MKDWRRGKTSPMIVAEEDLQLAAAFAADHGLEAYSSRFNDLVRELAEFRVVAYLQGYSDGETAILKAEQEF
jgi:hypothetical protein